MNFLMPSAWRGWTAIIIIAALFGVAILAKGQKMIHTIALIALAVVAVVGAYNTFLSKNG